MKIKDFFFSMIKVGCIGFGGGNALIPVLHHVFVRKERLLEEIEYEEDVVVASITPGALTIKLAGEIGRRIAGWKGMLAGASAMALPGVIFTVLVLSVMTNLNAKVVRQVEFVTVGIMAYISCMLTDYIIKTIQVKETKLKRNYRMIIISCVFILTCGRNLYRLLGLAGNPLFSIGTLDVFIMTFFIILYVGCFERVKRIGVAVLLCVLYVLCISKCILAPNDVVLTLTKGLMILLAGYGLRDQIGNISLQKLKWKEVIKEVSVMGIAVLVTLIPALFTIENALQYAGNGLLSSVMSFGGGDAYLTVADGLFVSTELICEDVFYGTIVPVANILPGSILCKVLSGIGYYIGFSQTGSVWIGYIVALVGFSCSFAASCGIVSVVGCLYRGFGEMPVFQAVKQWIRPIVSGLMLNVILSLINQSRVTGVSEGIGNSCVLVMLCLYILNLFLYYKRKTDSMKMVAISVILSVVMCNGVLWICGIRN